MLNKLIIFLIFFYSLLNASEVGVISECVLESSQPINYTGDTSGKRLYTQEEFTYLCRKKEVTQGECLEWENNNDYINVEDYASKKAFYQTEDFSGSMGEALAMTQAYGKVNGIFSGWKGYCQTGKADGNFDFLSDPYVLAGYAMQVGAAYVGGMDGSDIAAESFADAVVEGNKEAMLQAAEEYAKEYAKEQIAGYAMCAARAGLDTAQALTEYFSSDDLGCDPVDEICDEEDNNGSDEVFTVSESHLNDLLNANPELEEYVKIIKGKGSGTVTVKIVAPPVNNEASEEAAQKAKEAAEKVKQMMLKLKAAMITLQTSTCVTSTAMGKGPTKGGSTSSGGSIFSAQNLGVMALGAINPLVGLAATVLMDTFQALQNINTCSNRSDAEEKGSRHEATMDAKALDQCHFIRSEETGSKPFTDKKHFYYCCYDDKVSRILAQQSKAQLGKNWNHCTDISLKELAFLQFKACDPKALDASINGVSLPWDATQSERFQAYQYKNKCIDTRELVDHMIKMFAGDDLLIDSSDIESLLEDLNDTTGF